MLTYTPAAVIDSLETEQQIRLIKETFLSGLKSALSLHEVFAPLFVKQSTGLNDDLNGTEQPVSFRLRHSAETYAIVHSLAKWKRQRIQQLSIPCGEGIVTRMLALRPDETLSPTHSVLVDQWDWEQRLHPDHRTLDYLKATALRIYQALTTTAARLQELFGIETPALPPLTFIHTEDLQALYPKATPKAREYLATREYGAIFLIGIGAPLADGEPHDGRAPDYDDWTTPTSSRHQGLNGDLLVWHEATGQPLELSSMGIRVDAAALERQLQYSGTQHRSRLPYHQALLAGELPQTIGGGIGQSRLAMFLLQKQHIAEVQSCAY
jgi:aspartate--ammonia ligase